MPTSVHDGRIRTRKSVANGRVREAGVVSPGHKGQEVGHGLIRVWMMVVVVVVVVMAVVVVVPVGYTDMCRSLKIWLFHLPGKRGSDRLQGT